MTALIKRILKATDYIEEHLDDDFALVDVSSVSCYSHYHFLRIFHALTGVTVGTYIKRRRLTLAAESLLKGEGRIIDIALASGFESQAAFSRAFKDMFDVSPAVFRREKSASAFRGQFVITETYLQHIQTRGITMEPRFEHKESFTFIGLGRDYSLEGANTVTEIGTLWDEFIERKHLVTNVVEEAAFGICYAPKDKDAFSNNFRYTAALRVSDDADVPEGMEKIQVLAQEYAVFTHKGSLDTLVQTNDYIWKTWLPKSSLELADAPDIEVYGDKWNAENGTGEIDIYVPVKR